MQQNQRDFMCSSLSKHADYITDNVAQLPAVWKEIGVYGMLVALDVE